LKNKNWVVYLLRCSDKTLYCGISNNLKNRLKQHNSGKGAKYTRSRRPVELIGSSPELTKSEALKLEYRIKRLSADKKISEFTGERNPLALARNLQAIIRDLKVLQKKMKELIATL
jgi:putative endonuclease